MSPWPAGRFLLLTAPSPASEVGLRLADGLRQIGAQIDVAPFDREDAVRFALDRQSPDAVLLELTAASGVLPAQHVRHIEWTECGTRAHPILALIHERHLAMPELATLVDDFLLPPYRPSEVALRLTLIRQRRGAAAGRVVHVGGLEIDLAQRRVSVPGCDEPVLLTPREYELLAFLAAHRGMTFTRKMLLAQVWGQDYEGGPRTVDIHVRRLRAKIPSGMGDCIETVRYVGYRLVETPGPIVLADGTSAPAESRVGEAGPRLIQP